MQCKNCGRELPALATGRRPREYCNPACRQAHYRKSHQIAAPVADQSAEVDSLARQLQEAKERIEELETQVMRLQNKLDAELRYHTEASAYGFKSWLKRQILPDTPLVEKLLANQFLPMRGSRSLYEAHLRKDGYTPDEMAEFAHLWKAMLLLS